MTPDCKYPMLVFRLFVVTHSELALGLPRIFRVSWVPGEISLFFFQALILEGLVQCSTSVFH